MNTPAPTSTVHDGLRRDLARIVRRRVAPSDVEDVVQATLLEVLAARPRLEGGEELWYFSLFVARQKIADVHRRRARDERIACAAADGPLVAPAADAATDAWDLARWTERALPTSEDAGRTLEWMLREGEGEALSEIAEAERIAPVVVRQRVSRLRRLLRERWTREVGAVVVVVLLVAGAGAAWLGRRPVADRPAPARDALPAARVAPSASARSCDPPFVVDADGRRKYRIECVNAPSTR